MTEKQTEKPKERTVIDRSKVYFNEDGHPTVDMIFEDLKLPPETEVEIVAITEPEPEPEPTRELVRPEDVVWKDSNCDDRTNLVNALWGRVYAFMFLEDTQRWCWCAGTKTNCRTGIAETPKLAQQAVEEALADAKLYGFRWEEVEPEYIRYRVAEIRKDGVNSDAGWSHTRAKDTAMGHFSASKHHGNTALAVLSAQDKHLVWHELDRYEAKKIEDAKTS